MPTPQFREQLKKRAADEAAAARRKGTERLRAKLQTEHGKPQPAPPSPAPAEPVDERPKTSLPGPLAALVRDARRSAALRPVAGHTETVALDTSGDLKAAVQLLDRGAVPQAVALLIGVLTHLVQSEE